MLCINTRLYRPRRPCRSHRRGWRAGSHRPCRSCWSHGCGWRAGSHRPRRSCRSHGRTGSHWSYGSHRPCGPGWHSRASGSYRPHRPHRSHWPCRSGDRSACGCRSGRCHRNGGCGHQAEPAAGEYAGGPSAGPLTDTAEQDPSTGAALALGAAPVCGRKWER